MMRFQLQNTTTLDESDCTKLHAETFYRPTISTYTSLEAAYDWFNNELFNGTLPPCLITVQRHRGAYGYFSGGRFASTDDPGNVTDEIALNPQHFATRTREKVLSTLAHEMAHLWQHHYGKPSKAYHNKEWARKMRSIGLIPSSTGEPGGKETGQRVSHYIAEDGRFAQVCAAFLAEHPAVLYQDRIAQAEDEAGRAARWQKAASKTKFTCPVCRANAWGKPDLRLLCGKCNQRMEARLHRADALDRDHDPVRQLEFKKSTSSFLSANPIGKFSAPTPNSIVRNNYCAPHLPAMRLCLTQHRVRKKRIT